MKNKILIFSATFNESENIRDLLNSIDKLNLELDILIIDDNSPDKTSEVIKEYAAERTNIKLIIRNGKEGLDTAHKFAFKYSIENNYEYLITLDADLSHDPNEIPIFIKELEDNDFVIGSRYIKGGGVSMKGMRLFLSYFGNKFIKFILNINCNEFTTSYRGFNLRRFKSFNLDNVSSKGYSFFMETIYLIHKEGILIKEIPIYFKNRIIGQSKIPRIEVPRTFINLFKLKFFK
jgi:dolichol-phosphate mannosyltransferase